MPRVILQPAGGKEAKAHFAETVAQPVSLVRLAPHLTSLEVAHLASFYGKAGARVWGVTPGLGERNKRKWEKVTEGDAVLFCGDGKSFAYSFVTLLAHNRTLAEELWGVDQEGETWEYVYFVTRPFLLDASYQQIANVLGYSNDFVVLGFMVLDEVQSEVLWKAFKLADD
jgi:hypothetical protein